MLTIQPTVVINKYLITKKLHNMMPCNFRVLLFISSIKSLKLFNFQNKPAFVKYILFQLLTSDILELYIEF